MAAPLVCSPQLDGLVCACLPACLPACRVSRMPCALLAQLAPATGRSAMLCRCRWLPWWGAGRLHAPRRAVEVEVAAACPGPHPLHWRRPPPLSPQLSVGQPAGTALPPSTISPPFDAAVPPNCGQEQNCLTDCTLISLLTHDLPSTLPVSLQTLFSPLFPHFSNLRCSFYARSVRTT